MTCFLIFGILRQINLARTLTKILARIVITHKRLITSSHNINNTHNTPNSTCQYLINSSQIIYTMPSQTSLARHLLEHSTAVILKTTDSPSNEERIKDISKIFNGRLETVSTNNHVSIENEGKSNSVVILERSIQQFLLDSKDYVRTTVPYYVFVVLSDANRDTEHNNTIKTVTQSMLHRHECPGCTLELPSAMERDEGKSNQETKSCFDRSWFIDELTKVTEQQMSWKRMMRDELMDDAEYQEEMFEAVVEELEMASAVTIPSQWNVSENKWSECSNLEYLESIWKLSHSYKTTATLVGGICLEEQSASICETLRPVVRGGADIKTLNLQEAMDDIAQFLVACKTLRFYISLLQ